MSTTHYIPRPDAEFNTWTANFLRILSSRLEQFNFPAAEYEHLTELYADFSAKFSIASTPATRTKVAIHAKSESRGELERGLQQSVQEFLTHNRLVTDADRDNLGLPIYKKTRTVAPIATTYPLFEVLTNTIRRLTIYYFDFGSVHSRSRPVGQVGAEIRWAILENPPHSIKELINSAYNPVSPYMLEFNEDQRGKTLYFCLCWKNSRGINGPWSEIATAIIP
jgi:hypothetical protein